jgi:hypothetical protein
MDRNFRRVLYTALVAGGLMVVGASSAHAAEDGLLDPVTQGATDSVEEEPAARGALDTLESAPAGTGADVADSGSAAATDENGEAQGPDAGVVGERGLVGDLVGEQGIVGSLLGGDVAGVVDGTLGEGGLVDDLLTGGGEEPGSEEPGSEEPGTEEPGTEEPGTEEPGTEEPGTEEPGTEEPGTEEPGTEEPGTEEPGTEEPNTGKPGVGRPGSSNPGTSNPGTSAPVAGNQTGEVAESPTPGTTIPVDLEISSFPSNMGFAVDGYEDRGTPATEIVATSADTGRGLPGEGVDLGWGDKAGAVRPVHEGGYLPDAQYGAEGTSVEPEVETAPAVVPDSSLAETGHMITGQLSLISLLLGLGIAALRMRRR